MKSKKSTKQAELREQAALREQAEKAVEAEEAAPSARELEDPLRLLHELRVHQFELETQNEELRRSRDEIEALQREYANLFALAPMGYAILDPSGLILELNDVGRHYLGISESEALRKPLAMYVGSEDHDTFRLFCRDLAKSHRQASCEITMAPSCGEPFHARIEGMAVLNHEGEVSLHVALIDISDRVAAEANLRESHERLRLLFALAHDGIVVTQGATGRIVQVNPAACGILGYTEHQLLHMTPGDLPAPPGSPPPADHFAMFHLEGPVRGVLSLLHSKGRVSFIEYTARDFQKDLRMVFLHDITEEKLATEQLHHYSERLEELVEERAERIRELEHQRAESDKLAATGRIAARIAHEINNPLAGIKNAFLLVKDGVAEDYPYFKYVAAIEKEIDRIGRIVGQMFDLYQPDQEIAQKFRIGDVVDNVTMMLEPLCRQHQVTIGNRMPHFPVILFQPEGLVRQVLFNLVANAIEASPRGATVKINLDFSGDRLSMSVADHGPGISEETAARLFEPFFTTKTNAGDRGVGLGLSVSRTLVEMMGGNLTYQSKVGEGTVFRVVLPQNAKSHKA